MYIHYQLLHTHTHTHTLTEVSSGELDLDPLTTLKVSMAITMSVPGLMHPITSASNWRERGEGVRRGRRERGEGERGERGGRRERGE